MVELILPKGHSILLSRVRSTEGGEETVYCGLREAYNKLVHPVSWQTFFGYVTKGLKTGEVFPSTVVSQPEAGSKGRGQVLPWVVALDSTPDLMHWHAGIPGGLQRHATASEVEHLHANKAIKLRAANTALVSLPLL